MPRRARLCVALDEPTLDAATRVADALGGTVPVLKVGLELFCAAGPDAVRAARERSSEVFLDLKVCDIPRTAAGAARAARATGATYLTLHASGGRAMLAAAREAAPDLRLLVVSVLTSLDATALAETGVTRTLTEQVDAAAALAAEIGADGLVLSPREAARIRARHPGLVLVTPGIRPAGSVADDQERVDTPAAAVAAGADLLVVGRPVTRATDPAAAARAIVAEMDGAMVTR